MTTYQRPDVYMERQESKQVTIGQETSSSTGAIIAKFRRGPINKPTLVSSWTDFLNKFARGLDTPYLADDYGTYSVFGFFQNGGNLLYIDRIAKSAAKATIMIPTTSGVNYTAVDEGSWANTLLKVDITANAKDATLFDIKVTFNNNVVETYIGVGNDATKSNYYGLNINGISKYITIEENKTIAVGNGTLAGGTDGTGETDADYISAMSDFDKITDCRMIAVPGKTTAAIQNGLLAYCDLNQRMYPILDSVNDADSEAVITARQALSADTGGIKDAWIYVADPISPVGKLKAVPGSGHAMGIMARTDAARNVNKAAAGTEAIIRGAVSLVNERTDPEIGLLNMADIQCARVIPGIGIVMWGARSLNDADPKLKYETDIRYRIMVEQSLKKGTLFACFEPSDTILWNKLDTSVRTFLNERYLAGELKGTKPEEAYYVKCDAELNTEEVQDSGRVLCEYGYANKKPGEFIVLTLVQMTASTSTSNS
jgi:hypothetical protein